MDLDDVTATELQRMTGVHIKTARRWLAERHGISAGNKKMIQLSMAGHIVPEGWRDFFTFCGDYAVIDGAYSFDQEQLRGYWLLVQQKEWRTREVQRLTVKLEQQQQYIDYLEDLTRKADIVQFPAEKARPSATTGRESNPFFNKPGNC